MIYVISENVTPLDFQTIGTEHAEDIPDPTSYGNKQARGFGFPSLR